MLEAEIKDQPQPEFNLDNFREWLSEVGRILKTEDEIQLNQVKGDLKKEWEFCLSVFNLPFLVSYFGYPKDQEFPVKIEIFINGQRIDIEGSELLFMTPEMMELPDFSGFRFGDKVLVLDNCERFKDNRYSGTTFQIVGFDPPFVKAKFGNHIKKFYPYELRKDETN